MDDVRDFIAQNRALFNREELPQGHETRFFTRLAKEMAMSKRKLWSFRLLTTTAAAVLVLLTGWGITVYAFSESAVEARMLRQYRQQIEVLQQQVNDCVTALAPIEAEHIRYAVQLCTDDLELCAEWLPREISPAQRRETLKNYYAYRLTSMEQVVYLVKENSNN